MEQYYLGAEKLYFNVSHWKSWTAIKFKAYMWSSYPLANLLHLFEYLQDRYPDTD